MNDKINITKHSNYVNQETGEIIPIETTIKNKNVDKNFNKIWINETFTNTLNNLTKKENVVYYHLLNNKNSKNEIKVNKTKMAKELEISKNTLLNAFKKLEEGNIITRSKDYNNIYVFNPDFIFKGSYSRRQYCLEEYDNNVYKDKKEEEAYIKKIRREFLKLDYQEKYDYLLKHKDSVDEKVLNYTLKNIDFLIKELKEIQKNNTADISDAILKNIHFLLDGFFENYHQVSFKK